MSGDNRRLVVRSWLAVAGRDVCSARACLDAYDPIPETAAYRCQQAAEKVIEALLVLAEGPLSQNP